MSDFPSSPLVALSIAGFDCSAGAGSLADCRTFERLGVYGISALTSVVAQSPGNVVSIERLSKELLVQQLEELLRSYPIAAVKTGMLGSAAAIEAVSSFFAKQSDIPLVIDPVLSASAGAALTSVELVDHLSKKLFPYAVLVTPNLMEAEAILGIEIKTLRDMEKAAEKFYRDFEIACLVKGGHFEEGGSKVFDVLYSVNGSHTFSDCRLDIPDLHGTGCTLSAAISAELAKGKDLISAVKSARLALRKWMAAYHSWQTPRQVDALNAIDW